MEWELTWRWFKGVAFTVDADNNGRRHTRKTEDMVGRE